MSRRILICFILSLFVNSLISAQNKIQSPEEFFGFKPGSDRMLFTYEKLVDYLLTLDHVSDKLKMLQIGKSPLGKPMYVCFVSSSENISNLDKLKIYNKRLALDPAIPEEDKKEIISNGKIFLVGTLSMHSTEVGPSQASPLIAYDLITTKDENKLRWLNDVVYMIVPNHNPDGMDMIVDFYNKNKDTKYEGSSMPGVYHKYVGHDNNRDFVTLTQSDTKAISKTIGTDWFPQVMVEKHQMGSSGVRYFVPPNHDPIAENIDEGIWNWTGIFGMNMIKDMTNEGLAGVAHNYIFDDYWPGSTETCIWKNVIGFLTESASAQVAKPVYVDPTELQAGGKGLAEYKKSTNMPLPWPGGWWRLADIVEYEIVSTMSILKTASLHRKDILKFRNDLCIKEINKGKTIPPFYYIIPSKQHDKSELVDLVQLLQEHGINIYSLTKDVVITNTNYYKGDIVIPLAQPYRAFIKEVMEKQEYPVRRFTPDGEIMKPYDIASWSLPLHKGLESFEIKIKSTDIENSLELLSEGFNLNEPNSITYKAVAFTVNNNESYKTAFRALSKGIEVKRVAETVEAGGVTLEAGSFIIENGKELTTLLDEATVAPMFLESLDGVKTETLKLPRVALVESNLHDMDAGWTRFIFDSYSIKYDVVKPGEFESTDFSKSYDVVIFPNEEKDILMSGKYKAGENYFITSYPPEYTKGIGEKGFKNLMNFIGSGGKIISWENSTDLFMGQLAIGEDKNKDEFQLPIRDDSKGLAKKGLYCPGSFVKILLNHNSPITYGMEETTGAFYRGEPAFRTSIPNFDMDRKVIGYFPEKDALLSGYIEKEELLNNKSSLVWLSKGKGKFILFAFNPIFRASTPATYKLLFNSILL